MSQLRDRSSTNWGITPQLGHEIVTLKVGTGVTGQTFSVHKNLLSQKSPVFLAGFSEHFREGQTNEMNLPEDDPNAFGMLVHFLYTGNIPWQYADIHFENTGEDDTLLYLRLLVLGDKYLLPELQQESYKRLRLSLSDHGMPSLEFLETFVHIELASPKLKFYIANVCAYLVTQESRVDKPFDEFLHENPEFAAYFARVVVWRARIRSHYVGRVIESDHPMLTNYFDDYMMPDGQYNEFEIPNSSAERVKIVSTHRGLRKESWVSIIAIKWDRELTVPWEKTPLTDEDVGRTDEEDGV